MGLLGNIFRHKLVLSVISVIVFLLIWDLGVTYHLFSSYLPRPIEVLKALVNLAEVPMSGKVLYQHIWFSTKRVLIGYGIALMIGIPIGVLMAGNLYARAIISPIFELFKPMPPIAFISMAVLWFGIGEASKVFIIVIGAFVPLVINTFNGIRIVDEELYDVIRTLGGNRRDEIIQVMFPASFPAIFAGMQISLSLAFSCVLAAELVGAREGLGFIIMMGMKLNNTAIIVGGMVMIGIIAWAISAGITYTERWVCPWKEELKA
jgi:ABC-type nitrate/sulfonate/bicarbonate transport system permease component